MVREIYFVKQYVNMILFALRRISPTQEDLYTLIFMVLAPFLYLIKYKGELRTPIGLLVVKDSSMLRSFSYGLFKTHFAYMYVLRKLSIRELSFLVVIDVGANLGDFTLAMRGVAQKIVAVEPDKENFLALCANLEINSVKNVVPVRIAIHDRKEDVFLQGENSDKRVVREKEGEPVKGMSLDFLMGELEIERVSILKIDVQGHEMSVLMGSNSLLGGRLVNLLMVEVHLHRGISVRNIVSLMKYYGYSLIYKDPYLFLDQPHLYFVPGV